MKITPAHFENGKEVDFTQNYRQGNALGRASLRFKDNRYEVYIYWFNKKSAEVLYSSENLKDCIAFSNTQFDLTDTVEENEGHATVPNL